MNRDSVSKLRLDRRLLHRRGWLTPRERESALESLPDVSHKATTLGAVDAGEPAEPAAPEDPEPLPTS